MSYDGATNWAVGEATEKDDIDQVLANTAAQKDAGAERHLGGHPELDIVQTSFAAHPYGVDVEILGSNLGGHTVEVHVMAKVSGGTGQFRLYNVTDAGAVAGSTTNVTGTSLALVKSSAVTLASGTKVYRLQCLAASSETITIFGAKVVIR